VGGYSGATLAEDCDLTLSLQAAGWTISQDDEALAFTEAPEDVGALLAQRVRWTYGTLQSLAKHRNLFFRRRHGWLGMVVLPYTALSVLIPLIFVPFVAAMAVDTVRTQGWALLLVYFAVFATAHGVVASCALWLMGEPPTHLLLVPLYRLIYEPLRIYLLYTSAYLALRGVRTGWNKLRRTGDLDDLTHLGVGVQAPAPVSIPAQVPARVPVPVPAPTPTPTWASILASAGISVRTSAPVPSTVAPEPEPEPGAVAGASGADNALV
jgi:hypothetical protein